MFGLGGTFRTKKSGRKTTPSLNWSEINCFKRCEGVSHWIHLLSTPSAFVSFAYSNISRLSRQGTRIIAQSLDAFHSLSNSYDQVFALIDHPTSRNTSCLWIRPCLTIISCSAPLALVQKRRLLVTWLQITLLCGFFVRSTIFSRRTRHIPLPQSSEPP